ncbi:organic solute transporter Ostalpha-domain-containing protein [Lactifluus subvellereus]|nr:organic solute transporter Ostalpha-domain-containing protein [Lactifluus subvellereus]
MYSAYDNLNIGNGSGSALHPVILSIAVFATAISTFVSAASILVHIKNYRKPMLQRMVVRIMLMVPIYAISSLISLFSLEAAFVIDAIRDIYEAFVIYCFFQLLLGYLGGERSLLILVHGRPPKVPPFPANIFQRELDVSDPYTFLFLKRGILQYVQVKPLLAITSLALKASGRFNEGEFRADSGYLYVSIVYNASICLSLYCLAMFWLSISEDLKPFRPMPKFLCVKGILFFSFWQATGVSLLASVGAIKQLGPYTDKEHISLGLTDTLICLEMPFFAIAHLVAFSHQDYIDKKLAYVGRMPMRYAFRDAFGLKDVLGDARATLNGEGMDYREFEPSEGQMHQGLGRERRIRAGLRYSRGGQGKYWLPQPTSPTRRERSLEDDVSAPLLIEDVEHVVHDPNITADEGLVAIGFDLSFGDLDSDDEDIFASSRKYLFGDYNYPCIDASSEVARAEMWEEEERILSNERSAWFSDYQGRRAQVATTYGAIGVSRPEQDRSHTPSTPFSAIHPEPVHEPAGDLSNLQLRWTNVFGPRSGSKSATSPVNSGVSFPSISTGTGPFGLVLRPDALDLVVEDPNNVEPAVTHERQQGEPQPQSATGQVHHQLVGNVGRARVAEECEQFKSDPSTSPAPHRSAETETDTEIDTEANTNAGTSFEVVARLGTPPHARTKGLASRYDDLEDDTNPWA